MTPTRRCGCTWHQKKAFKHPDNPQYHHFRTVLLEVLDLLVDEESRGMPYAVERVQEAAQRVAEAREKLAVTLPVRADRRPRQGLLLRRPGQGQPARVFTSPWDSPRSTAVREDRRTLPELRGLRELAEQEIPWAKEWQIYTLLTRAESMYYTGWADKCGPDNRIRARTRQLGTVSTRFSIERANLQAMPHDGKLAGLAFVGLDDLPTPRQLIARQVTDTMPGWVLMEYDLSQAELRLGALLSKCKKMLEAYFEDVDLHQFTANQVGAPRQVGKVANLSLEYGAGWQTLGDMMVKMTGGKVKMNPSGAASRPQGLPPGLPGAEPGHRLLGRFRPPQQVRSADRRAEAVHPLRGRHPSRLEPVRSGQSGAVHAALAAGD
jgi:hypothetical protein